MKRPTKIILGAVLLAGVAGALAVWRASNRDGDLDVPTVTVEFGTIVDRALAVGRIEPEVEIEVKSQLAGVVRRRFAEVGEFVESGAPLLEIQPQPTPQELVGAKRQMELRDVELRAMEREVRRQEDLLAQSLVSEREYEDTQRRYQQAKIQLQMAREQLQLLQEGRISVASDSISTTIHSPIDGFVLEKMVDVGDPVVPLTSFQEGTVLMSMAGMDHLLFRGTVDEIDVRLRCGSGGGAFVRASCVLSRVRTGGRSPAPTSS